MNRIKRRTINLAWKYVTRLFSNANNSNNAGDDDDEFSAMRFPGKRHFRTFFTWKKVTCEGRFLDFYSIRSL